MKLKGLKYFRSKLVIVGLVYFGLVTLLMFSWHWKLILLWLGGFMGLYFIYVDRLVYVYLVKPHEQLSEQVKHMLRAKRIKEAIVLLDHR